MLFRPNTLAMSFKRLIRFVPASNSSTVLLGEPVDSNQDVGVASRKGQEIQARVYSGKSVFDLGSLTDNVEKVSRILSPLTQTEAGTIRCIGLNVSSPVDLIHLGRHR